MERKHSYSEIKLIYFDCALDFCRQHFNRGIVSYWEYTGGEYGFAIDNIPEFQHPLEQLMFTVIIAIENAGRHISTHIGVLESIKQIISNHTLEKLIADLTPEERRYEDEGFGFLCDLNLVLNNQELEADS